MPRQLHQFTSASYPYTAVHICIRNTIIVSAWCLNKLLSGLSWVYRLPWYTMKIEMDPILAMWHAACCAHPIASLSNMLWTNPHTCRPVRGGAVWDTARGSGHHPDTKPPTAQLATWTHDPHRRQGTLVLTPLEIQGSFGHRCIFTCLAFWNENRTCAKIEWLLHYILVWVLCFIRFPKEKLWGISTNMLQILVYKTQVKPPPSPPSLSILPPHSREWTRWRCPTWWLCSVQPSNSQLISSTLSTTTDTISLEMYHSPGTYMYCLVQAYIIHLYVQHLLKVMWWKSLYPLLKVFWSVDLWMA